MKPKPKFSKISEPNLHGFVAAVDNRRAEVVQVSQCDGTWHCFQYIDGKMVIGKRPDTDYASAMKEAKVFLSGSEK